jgi:hypothetical protein
MARTFTLPKKGNGQWSNGWHTLTVTKAEYGELGNGAKFIDVFFDGYPENFNLRVYAKSGQDGQEFAIGNLFRFANAGITDALESATGDTVIKMNDDATELVGKTFNAFFYKNGKFTRILPQIAPVPFKNIVEEFNTEDVSYYKGKAETFFQKWVKPKIQEEEEKEAVTETSDIPF